jgi:gluconate 5-dehydrogenase
MSNPFSLQDKVAFVSGSSRGLGWAIAKALSEAGARVVLHGRDETLLGQRVDELARAGGDASCQAFDIADLGACAAAVKKVIADHGCIDVLVNNAGMPSRKPLTDLTVAEWQQVMDTNLNSCFVLTREAARSMIARRWGRILMISSSGIIVARPTISAYVSSKAGLAGMARQLAVELGPHNITVNAIAPGLFLTDMARGIPNTEAAQAYVRGRAPLGRCGDPAEMGPIAVFLASEASSYVTGQLLTVDGGLSVAL